MKKAIVFILVVLNCTPGLVASTLPTDNSNATLENALAHTAKAMSEKKEKAAVYEALRSTHHCLTMRLHNDLTASAVVKNDVDKAYANVQKAALQENTAKKALLAILEKDIVLNEKEFTVYAQ
jgi:hypothetical protein